MPVYLFRDMNGKQFRVETEDGVSEAEAFRLFQKRPDRATYRDQYDATAGMGTGEKLLANLGAGIASTARGVGQWFPGGADDAEVAEARERDTKLADSVAGGGLTQIAGEILPWLAVPAGGFARTGARALNLARSGLGAEKMAMPLGRIGTSAATIDAALAGAAGGASQPTMGHESRAFNAALGAAGGAVLPTVLGAARGARRLFTKRGSAERAAEDIIAELGGDDAARAAADKVKAYKPGAFVDDVPLSTAEVAESAPLGRMQLASMTRGDKTPEGIGWEDFRTTQAHQRWGALQDITEPGRRVPEIKAARDKVANPKRAQALATAAKDQWFHEPVVKATQAMLEGGSGSNPAVQSVAGYVAGELGNRITPERLYTVRKVLAQKLSGPAAINDDLAAAAKQAQTETLGMIKAIDEALNRSSRGQWQRYLDAYVTGSKPVDDARALEQISERYAGEGVPMVGGVPSLTRHSLGGAVDKAGSNVWGDRLSYGSRDALSQLLDNIRRSEDLMGLVKNTGTGGGGSQTGMVLSQLAKEGAQAVAGGPLTRAAQHVGEVRSTAFKRAALADALMNPDAFVRGVERKLAQGKPLTYAEEGVLQIVRAASMSPVAAVTQ